VLREERFDGAHERLDQASSMLVSIPAPKYVMPRADLTWM